MQRQSFSPLYVTDKFIEFIHATLSVSKQPSHFMQNLPLLIQKFLKKNNISNEYGQFNIYLNLAAHQAIQEKAQLYQQFLNKFCRHKFRGYAAKLTHHGVLNSAVEKAFWRVVKHDQALPDDSLKQAIHFLEYHAPSALTDIFNRAIQFSFVTCIDPTINYIKALLLNELKNARAMLLQYITREGAFIDCIREEVQDFLQAHGNNDLKLMQANEMHGILGLLMLPQFNLAMHTAIESICIKQIEDEIRDLLLTEFAKNRLGGAYSLAFFNDRGQMDFIQCLSKLLAENSLTKACLTHQFLTEKIEALARNGWDNIIKNEIQQACLCLADKILKSNAKYVTFGQASFLFNMANPSWLANEFCMRYAASSSEYPVGFSAGFYAWFVQFVQDAIIPNGRRYALLKFCLDCCMAILDNMIALPMVHRSVFAWADDMLKDLCALAEAQKNLLLIDFPLNPNQRLRALAAERHELQEMILAALTDFFVKVNQHGYDEGQPMPGGLYRMDDATRMSITQLSSLVHVYKTCYQSLASPSQAEGLLLADSLPLTRMRDNRQFCAEPSYELAKKANLLLFKQENRGMSEVLVRPQALSVNLLRHKLPYQ